MLECGLKYKLTRIDGYAETPAWWSIGGSAVHVATEVFDSVGQGDAEALFGQALNAEVARAEVIDADRTVWRSSRGQDEPWWRDNGPLMVQRWIDWRAETGWMILDPEPENNVFGVETPWTVELGLPVKGYIDRVFVTPAGEVVIVDIKTGARKPASAVQLGYYRVGLMIQYGVTADLGGFWMGRKNTPAEQFEVQGLTKFSPEYVARMVDGFKRARDAGLYLPHVTVLCKSCPVAQHCWALTGVSQHDANPVASMPQG